MPPKPVRNYSVGDLVFAKIKGYPPWPARIEKDLPNGYKPYPNRYPVFFFGTNELAVVSAKEIYPYEQYKHQLGIRRKKMKNFNEGLDEIEKHPNLSIDSEEISTKYRQEMSVDLLHNQPEEFTDSDVSYSDPKSEESESSSDLSESDPRRETKITSTTKIKRNSSNSTRHRKNSIRSRKESSSETGKNEYRKDSNLKKTSQTEKTTTKRVSRRAIYVPDDDDCISSSESDPPPPKLVAKIVVNDSNDSEVAFSDGNTSYGHISPPKSINQNGSNLEENSPDSQDDDLLAAALYESRKRAKVNQEEKSEPRKKPKLAEPDKDSDTKVQDNSNISNNEKNKKKNDDKKSIQNEENIEDVLKLKQKLLDEKLAQKLEEKEKEKERRKREKMERKRLERLKQQQFQKSGLKPSQRPEEDQIKAINKILVEIDQSIKNSLSKNNANIDKCLEAMNNIDEVKGKITSKSLSNYSDNLKELIQTLKKCRKYKPEERVRQKADLYFNKLKEFFIHPNDSQATVSSTITSTDDAAKTEDDNEEKSMKNIKDKSVGGNDENQAEKPMKSTNSKSMEENSSTDDNQQVVSSTTLSIPMDSNNSD